jgi:outer membrane receptor protein involved in Fe transport
MQNSIRCRPQSRRCAYLYCSSATVFISWLTAGSVSAQQSTAPPPANPQSAPAPSVSAVTVVAPTPGYKSTIDGRSYSITNDLQKSFGTLAGVLGHLPAVQVDPEGNLSLRGDSNVTILVDGKPSALFSGPGRATALQSVSPDQFDRVEIMTNPSAGQTAEGSGGVINLISKSKPKGQTAPTASGTVKANVGSGGRYDLGATGAYSAKGLSLSGGGDYSQSGFNRSIETRYQIPDPTTGALVPADGVQRDDNRLDVLTLYGSLGYDIDPRDHLDFGLNYLSVRQPQGQDNTYLSSALTGPLALAYDSSGFVHLHLTEVSESLGLTHTFPDSGHSLSFKLSLSQGGLTTENVATYNYQTPVQPSLYQSQALTAAYPDLDLKIDYKTPLPNKAKLTVGYEGKVGWQSEDNAGVAGASSALAVTDSAFAQSFTLDQQVEAIYATYEQAFGKLTFQPGLRLETTTLQTDLVSANQKGSQTYFEAYPSLHLNYDLDDTSQFHASYGRRVRRPDELQLDPFRTESSETLYTAGNPNLRPSFTQTYELGYEFHQKSTDLQANLFYRDKSDVLTTVTQDIGGDVLLQTSENIGHAHDKGLELVANYDLTKTLSVNASTDLMNSDVNASNLGALSTRSAFIASGKATLNWQVTRRDYVQLSGQDTGKQLTAQGYTGGAVFSDLGWRHRFDSGLAAVVTAQDPFGLSRRTNVIDTPTLVDVQERKFRYTAVFVGLSYTFGGSSKRAANNFDFGAKAPGDQ